MTKSKNATMSDAVFSHSPKSKGASLYVEPAVGQRSSIVADDMVVEASLQITVAGFEAVKPRPQVDHLLVVQDGGHQDRWQLLLDLLDPSLLLGLREPDHPPRQQERHQKHQGGRVE